MLFIFCSFKLCIFYKRLEPVPSDNVLYRQSLSQGCRVSISFLGRRQTRTNTRSGYPAQKKQLFCSLVLVLATCASIRQLIYLIKMRFKSSSSKALLSVAR